jgi:hypothetical protein
MKSIGEISIAATQGEGFREFSSCEERERVLPQEPQLSYPKGGGTDCAPLLHTALPAQLSSETERLRKRG